VPLFIFRRFRMIDWISLFIPIVCSKLKIRPLRRGVFCSLNNVFFMHFQVRLVSAFPDNVNAFTEIKGANAGWRNSLLLPAFPVSIFYTGLCRFFLRVRSSLFYPYPENIITVFF
jgi:hypothetical protein